MISLSLYSLEKNITLLLILIHLLISKQQENLMRKMQKAYDRIIIISDNEVNSYNLTSSAYKAYIRDVCSPYIYAVDLAAYGTTPVKNDGKVNYYYGYGYSMFDDIASKEFNPEMHIDKIRKVVI